MKLFNNVNIITRQYFRNFCTKRKKPLNSDYVKEMPGTISNLYNMYLLM